MATKSTPKPADNLSAALPESLVQEPANRAYVFAKNCTNDHGVFVIGDKARGAFSADLVASYLAAGVLVAKA